MKLNRLKSVARDALRTSQGSKKGYLIDPFSMYTPEIEFEIDLITANIIPDCDGDDVEIYYKEISAWFHEVLPKEGIPEEIIDKAIIKISPKEKKCIIKAQGRLFTASHEYK